MGQSSCKAPAMPIHSNSSCEGLPCCNYGSNQCRSQDGEIVPVTNSDPCGLNRAAVGTKCTNERNDVLIKLRDAFESCQTQMSAKFWDNVLAADGFVVDQCFVESDIDNARTALFEKALALGCDQEHAVAHCNAKDTLGNYENIFGPSSKTFEDRYSACLLAQGCVNVQCSCTGDACSRCESSYSNLSNSKVSGNENKRLSLRNEQNEERKEDMLRRKDVEPCFSGLQWSDVVGEQLNGRCTPDGVKFNWEQSGGKWKQRCEALAARLGVPFESTEPQTLPFGCIADGMPEYPWDPVNETFENVAGKGSISQIKFVRWKSGTTSRKVAGTCVDDYGDGPAGENDNETDCATNGFRWVPDWYSLCLGENLRDASFDARSWHVLDADANQPHVCEDTYGDVVDKSEAACSDDGEKWVLKAYAVAPSTSSLLELETVEASMAAVLADMEEKKIWPSVQACDARCRTLYPPTEDCVGWKNKALGYCRKGCGVDWYSSNQTEQTCLPSDTTVPDGLTREYAAAHLIRVGKDGHAPWMGGVFKGPTADFPASECGVGDDRVACEYGFGFWRGEAVMAMNTEVSSPTMWPPDCAWKGALEANCHLKPGNEARRRCFSNHACHNVVCTEKLGRPVCVPPVAKHPTYPVLKIDVEYTETEAEVAGHHGPISTCDEWVDDTLFQDYDEATRTKNRDACRNGARMLPLPKEAQRVVLLPAAHSEEDRCGPLLYPNHSVSENTQHIGHRLRNLTLSECRRFARQHNKSFENTTGIYAIPSMTGKYGVFSRETAEQYWHTNWRAGTGVYEGTHAKVSNDILDGKCNAKRYGCQLFPAGNDKWRSACWKINDDTCPDELFPVVSSCKQIRGPVSAQRAGEVLADLHASPGSAFPDVDLTRPDRHRKLNRDSERREAQDMCKKKQGTWVDERQFDPIGCSLNNDGIVVFRSSVGTRYTRIRGFDRSQDPLRYILHAFSDKNQRSVCVEQNCTENGDCPASQQLVSSEDFEAAVAAGDMSAEEKIIHTNTRNAMQNQTTIVLDDGDDGDGCKCVRHSQGTGRSRVRVECGEDDVGEWSEWVGYDAAASATAYLDTKHLDTKHLDTKRLDTKHTKQCTIRRAEQCPALISKAGKPDEFDSCEEAGLVTCNATQCCRVAGSSGYVDTFGPHEMQAAARADCEARGLRLCAKEEVVSGSGVGWVAGVDFPGERTSDGGPWVVAFGGNARCDLPYGAHCCRTCSQNEIERNWEEAAYWSS